MMTKPTLLIASTNPGKLREFQEIFSVLLQTTSQALPAFTLVLPSQIGIHLDVVEDGKTYAENAAKKALAYCRASELITLADDSGLAVDALGGQPGLYSARYAPWPNATDADRRRYLLQNLQGVPQPWQAHFHCSLAIATPQGELYQTEGKVFGEVIAEERGSNGFGYDPVFYMPERGLTMAELGSDDKNQISHRARAVAAALPRLAALLQSGG